MRRVASYFRGLRRPRFQEHSRAESEDEAVLLLVKIAYARLEA